MDQVPPVQVSSADVLVLSRQRDEKIEVLVPASTAPTLVVCTVVDIRGDKVRLGFDAPKAASVHRAEVAQKMREEGKLPIVAAG